MARVYWWLEDTNESQEYNIVCNFEYALLNFHLKKDQRDEYWSHEDVRRLTDILEKQNGREKF